MMKSIIWFYILVSCFSVIYCTDQPSGSVYEEFGCQFENNKYAKRVNGFFDIAYSDKPIDGMEFTDANTFGKFITNIKTINGEMIKKNAFNSYNEFAIFYNNFKIQKKDLKSFYQSYRPKYIPYDTSPGFTVELLKLISASLPNIAPHVYLATAYLNVTERYIKEIVNHELPPRFFLHNHVAGVIKMKYIGRIGYVIMDPGLGLKDPVIIMEDGKAPHKDKVDGTTRHFNSESFTFNLKQNNYLEAKTVLNRNGRKHENHLYFLGKRFCSILETTLKNNLISPQRFITIRDENADFITTMKMTFISTMKKCQIITYKERFLRSVQKVSFTKTEFSNKDKSALEKFSKLYNVDKYQFREKITEAKSIYYYAAFSDFFDNLFTTKDEIVNKLRIKYAPGENPEEKTNASYTDLPLEDMLYKLKTPTMIVIPETAERYKAPPSAITQIATTIWSRGDVEDNPHDVEYDL